MARKLLDQMRDAIRLKHYSFRTEESYIDWARRFILFHNKRHPNDMGAAEINAFLVYLATQRNVAASTQNQALSAILFLYREVLHKKIEPVLLSSAKRPERLLTVLTHEEVLHLIHQLIGTHKLMAQLLYGSGLRLMECLRLHIKDIDFEYKTITVRDGMGEKTASPLCPIPLFPTSGVRSNTPGSSMKKTWLQASVKFPFPMPWKSNIPMPPANSSGNTSFLLPSDRLTLASAKNAVTT